MINSVGALSGITASTLEAKTTIEKEENEINEFSKIFENAKASENNEEIKEACTKFETYFLQLMMKEMRKTIDTDNSFIKESNAEKIYKEYLDNELMEQASNMGGVGLADSMYESLTRNIN